VINVIEPSYDDVFKYLLAFLRQLPLASIMNIFYASGFLAILLAANNELSIY
jgi:hypothetical protein